MNIILHGDCLELMKDIPTGSIDMILCDLPYGTTKCSWDVIIPFESLWKEYERIIKDRGAIVLFCQQPFTSALIVSNLDLFRYTWYWKKSRPGGFVNSNNKPLKDIEDIAVFSKGTTANGSVNKMIYIPQGIVDVNIDWKRPKTYGDGKGVNMNHKSNKTSRKILKQGYPRQVLEYSNTNKNLLHPTQKPVSLFEYLIKTYTNEGDTVLDNCAGSGTTGIACMNTNRNYILIEKEQKYYDIILDRIKKHQSQLTMF